MEKVKYESVTQTSPGDVTPARQEIERALARILASQELEGAERIQSFLSYVVLKTLDGEGDEINAKAILYDVYGRSPQAGLDSMAVVRVDAGRLRRKLAEYYSGSGKEELVHILVNPGGYVPQFTQLTAHTSNQASFAGRRKSRFRLGLIAVSALAIGLVGLIFAHLLQRNTTIASGSEDTVAVSDRQKAVRAALFSDSPARLQAVNLAGRARTLLFPALEPEWLRLVLNMFELSIELDSGYFGGHAGAAQAQALISISAPEGPPRSERLDRAKKHVVSALEHGIDHSWTHSAAALVAFISREFDQANRYSSRAVALDPNDVHSINIDALIALFSGNFERAIRQADRTMELEKDTSRFPSLSIKATARIHLGEFDRAEYLLTEAMVQGHPVSPISLGYLITAQIESGNDASARATLRLLNDTWPGYPMRELFLSLYKEPGHVEQIISALKTAGWVDGSVAKY